MKIIDKIFDYAFTVSFVLLLIVIAMPILAIFLLIFYPINYFQDKKFEKEYLIFLKQINGKNFFCYNNRLNSKDFIEEVIIPNLRSDVEIIYLDGKEIVSDYPPKYISVALYRLHNYHKFPHLLAIRNDQVVDMSVNNVFYTILNQNQPLDRLFNQMNSFFNNK